MKHKLNDQIQSNAIDLIDIETGAISRVSFKEAIEKAEAQELDLVEFSCKEGVSVCKIMNYGKFLYNSQKTKSSAAKKPAETKEMRFNPSIGKEDFEIKIKKVRAFLTEGSKVLISIKMKGREREHVDITQQLLEKIKQSCEDLINLKLSDGKQMSSTKISCILVAK